MRPFAPGTTASAVGSIAPSQPPVSRSRTSIRRIASLCVASFVSWVVRSAIADQADAPSSRRRAAARRYAKRSGRVDRWETARWRRPFRSVPQSGRRGGHPHHSPSAAARKVSACWRARPRAEPAAAWDSPGPPGRPRMIRRAAGVSAATTAAGSRIRLARCRAGWETCWFRGRRSSPRRGRSRSRCRDPGRGSSRWCCR